MKLDRTAQLTLLQRLTDCYPDTLDHAVIKDLEKQPGFLANLIYLKEHGLLEANVKQILGGDWHIHSVKANAQGMDFLADDGGLSAILGVVTIRLHDDTIKSLVAGRIEASDLPPEDKKRYLGQLRELPAETTKHLVLKLVDLGLEKGPAAIAAIGSFLGTLSA